MDGSPASQLRPPTTPSQAPCSKPMLTASPRSGSCSTDNGAGTSRMLALPPMTTPAQTIVINSASSHSEVEVTYELTALTGATGRTLREFADGYATYLRSWQDAITVWLHSRELPPSITTDARAAWWLVRAMRRCLDTSRSNAGSPREQPGPGAAGLVGAALTSNTRHPPPPELIP
jgi:hypothetical protein